MFAEQMKLIEEELVPFGFIEDGKDDGIEIPGDSSTWVPAGEEWQRELY